LAASLSASNLVACATTVGGARSRPSVGTLVATCGSGLGFGTNSLGCEKSAGASSLRVTITRTPRSVMGHSFLAKSCDIRMQPCEAGWPGSTPSCNATPDQVMRCMYGIGALL